MENEQNLKQYHLPSYGLALMKYLNLPTRLSQREHLQKVWHEVYRRNNHDPISAVVEFFGNIFPMMESGERRMGQDDFYRRAELVLKRIKESEVKEKYESGELDKLLLEQETL